MVVHWLPILGIMPLNSLIMQDNISKMNDKLKDARSECDKIDDTLKEETTVSEL